MSRILLLTLYYARRNPGGTFAIVIFLVLCSLIGNAACFYLLEPDTSITIEDALWYSIISMTTIGYGDFSATTTGSRVATVVFIVLFGLAAFTLLLGLITDTIANYIERGKRGMSDIFTKNHIIIVNFPGETKIRQVIKEFRADPAHRKQDIVILTDQRETLPFSMNRVHFVHGSPLLEETFKRAGLQDAKTVLVLAPDYSGTNSDAIVASVIQFIESLYPNIHTIAECLDENHGFLFQHSRCDSVIFGPQISSNLLVQELQDPGIAQMVRVLTTNSEGSTVYTTQVTKAVDTPYTEVAVGLLAHDINFIGVNRGPESITNFKGLVPAAGDCVIYISKARNSWPELLKLASKAKKAE